MCGRMSGVGPARLRRKERERSRDFGGQGIAGGDEFLVGGIERLGKDARFAQHRHEIMIAGPPWDNVQMQMVGNAGSGAGAEVQANIEALRFDGFAQDGLGERRELEELQALGVAKVSEIGGLAIGHSHHVADGVGEAVQHEKAVLAPGDHVVRGIIGGLGGFGEEIPAHRLFEILGAPGRPEGREMFETHARERARADAGSARRKVRPESNYRSASKTRCPAVSMTTTKEDSRPLPIKPASLGNMG